jgi:hypothetical protein
MCQLVAYNALIVGGGLDSFLEPQSNPNTNLILPQCVYRYKPGGAYGDFETSLRVQRCVGL